MQKIKAPCFKVLEEFVMLHGMDYSSITVVSTNGMHPQQVAKKVMHFDEDGF